MEWIKRHDYLGSEFDFVASDTTGCVAYFSSAGFGPIPKQSAQAGEQMYDICEKVDQLPRVSRADEVSSEPNIGEWVAAAERGFFAYDWSHERARYELVARPVAPIRVSDLKAQATLRDFVEGCVSEFEFGSTKYIET